MIFRQMTMTDADKMLEWKNYEETRKYAIFSHDEIKREDHYRWLPDNIQYFRVIETDLGQPVGAIRLQGNEISIWLDREFRNEGLAFKAITKIWEEGTTEGGSQTIIAKIVDGNIASLRAFIRAGFLPVSHQDNHYIFER